MQVIILITPPAYWEIESFMWQLSEAHEVSTKKQTLTFYLFVFYLCFFLCMINTSVG